MFASSADGWKDLATLFEAAYIGLYERDGLKKGHIEFFDAACNPPRSGRPLDTLTFEQMIQRVKASYEERNLTFRFAESPTPVTAAEVDEPEDEAETESEAGASDDEADE